MLHTPLSQQLQKPKADKQFRNFTTSTSTRYMLEAALAKVLSGPFNLRQVGLDRDL